LWVSPVYKPYTTIYSLFVTTSHTHSSVALDHRLTIYSLFVTTSHTHSSVALDHRLTPHTAPSAFYTVACCLLSESTAVSRVTSQWEALPRHRGGGEGGLQSANTSQYYTLWWKSFMKLMLSSICLSVFKISSAFSVFTLMRCNSFSEMKYGHYACNKRNTAWNIQITESYDGLNPLKSQSACQVCPLLNISTRIKFLDISHHLLLSNNAVMFIFQNTTFRRLDFVSVFG
jgi:hypothetical protein